RPIGLTQSRRSTPRQLPAEKCLRGGVRSPSSSWSHCLTLHLKARLRNEIAKLSALLPNLSKHRLSRIDDYEAYRIAVWTWPPGSNRLRPSVCDETDQRAASDDI